MRLTQFEFYLSAEHPGIKEAWNNSGKAINLHDFVRQNYPDVMTGWERYSKTRERHRVWRNKNRNRPYVLVDEFQQ